MCGIIGCIGIPENPILSYNLMTSLLQETQRRGKHATGFYAVDLNNEIIYDKMPVESKQYVHFIDWKKVMLGTKVLIGHCRHATQGNILDNRNNHPFVSKSKKIGLIHNGIVYLYDKYKNKYKKVLESECDSEIILRIICREKDALVGIKKAFSLLGPRGDFSCEMVHVQQNGKILFYFFRDDGRPGKFINAFEETGQYFFCSEEEIWKSAVKNTGMQALLGHLKVEDIPPYQIWVVDTDTMKIFKVKVKPPTKTYTYTPVVYKGGYSSTTTGYRTTYEGPAGPTNYGNGYEYGRGSDWHGSVSNHGSAKTTSHGFKFEKGKGGSSPASYPLAQRSSGNIIPVSSLSKTRTSHLRMDWEETKNKLNLPRFVEKAKVPVSDPGIYDGCE